MGKTEKDFLKQTRKNLRENKLYIKSMQKVVDEHRGQIKSMMDNAPKAFYLWCLARINKFFYKIKGGEYK